MHCLIIALPASHVDQPRPKVTQVSSTRASFVKRHRLQPVLVLLRSLSIPRSLQHRIEYRNMGFLRIEPIALALALARTAVAATIKADDDPCPQDYAMSEDTGRCEATTPQETRAARRVEANDNAFSASIILMAIVIFLVATAWYWHTMKRYRKEEEAAAKAAAGPEIPPPIVVVHVTADGLPLPPPFAHARPSSIVDQRLGRESLPAYGLGMIRGEEKIDGVEH